MDESLYFKQSEFIIETSALTFESECEQAINDLLLEDGNSGKKKRRSVLDVIKRMWEAVVNFFNRVKDKIFKKPDAQNAIKAISESDNKELDSIEFDVVYTENSPEVQFIKKYNSKLSKIVKRAESGKEITDEEYKELVEALDSLHNDKSGQVAKKMKGRAALKKWLAVGVTVGALAGTAATIAGGVKLEKGYEKKFSDNGNLEKAVKRDLGSAMVMRKRWDDPHMTKGAPRASAFTMTDDDGHPAIFSDDYIDTTVAYAHDQKIVTAARAAAEARMASIRWATQEGNIIARFLKKVAAKRAVGDAVRGATTSLVNNTTFQNRLKNIQRMD